MKRRAHVVAVTLAATLTACQDSPRPRFDGATTRLATGAISAAAVDGTSLGDRDTTTGVAVSAPVTIDVAFDHDVEVRAIKLFVQGTVQVSGAGLDGETLSGNDEWVRRPSTENVQGRRFSITVAPAGGAARIGELELWGAGLPRAPRDLGTLARVSASNGARFEDALVVRGSVAAASLQPTGAQQGGSCVRSRFAGFSPRASRRAYLVYEANVQRPVVLSRSLNAAAPVGGFWIASGAESRTITDELDPERLTGDDEVQLCAPGEASGPVSVSGLRLLVLLDAGTEHWDRETRRLLSGAADGDDATSSVLSAGRHDLGLDRSISVDADEARVTEAAAPQGQVGVLEPTGWTELGDVTWGSPASLGIAGRTIQGAHVDFGGAPSGPGARVAELRLAGSGVGRRIVTPRIVITYPETRIVDGREIGERFGSKAFVSGWAESPSGPGLVEVGGARVSDGGVFATEVERPITSTGSWAAIVHARFPDGTEITRTIEFEDDRESEVRPGTASTSLSDNERFGRENQGGWGEIDPELGGKVKLGTDVELEAPPGAVGTRTAIGITRKGSEVMPPLDAGMVNVTAPAHFAYRFLPKGQKFAKAVKVKIPYDPALLPEGTAPEEIQTYYYDDLARRWQPLPRVEVSRELQRVTSETTHFTFMINAVLVLPDHPGPVSFNPNSIKDLKAADPSSNVDLIAPPQPNNQGTAQLSFPVRLPKARGAYQPTLRLSYDSAAGNGWAGVGWSLPVSSVAIDTKYGVPYYDGLERYVLDGAQLVPGAAGDGICVDGGNGRYYRARVEREFKRIVRCGTGVGDYRFEVTDRSGVLHLYGTTSDKRLMRPAASPGVPAIAEWYLDRVIDLNGNLTVYGYDFDSAAIPALDGAGKPDGVAHGEPFTQAYLRSVTYSGRAPRTGAAALAQVDEAGAYRVELRSERNGRTHLLRPDVISSARTGFKVLTRRRLGSITVTIVDGAGTHGIREYRLAYGAGSYGKSRLEKIAVLGAWEPGATAPLFHEHVLGYYDAPDGDDAKPFHDPEPLVFPDGGDEQALSRSESWGYGVHGYVGIGPVTPASISVGVRAGFNQSRSTNVSTFLDVNGDWLPDRIRLGSSGAQVRFNDGERFTAMAPGSDPYDGRRISTLPISTLGHSSSTSFNVALQAKASVFSASYGKSWFTSDTPDFLVDVDGDGLVDVLDRGKVLFNQERAGNPQPDCTLPDNSPTTFCFAQTKWVRQIGAAAPPADLDLTADLSDDPEIAATVEEIEAQLRPADTLVEWLAPYAGAVEISGSLHFPRAAAAQIDPSWDGVRLSIYKVTVEIEKDGAASYFNEPVGEPITIRLAELTVPTPVYVPAVEMERGSRLYFVLSTLSSFPVAKPGPFPLEEVSFSPTISYLDAPMVGGFEPRDPTNAPLYRFDAFEDFRLAGAPLSAVTVPADGTLEVRSILEKKPCGDDVRVCVQKFGADEDVRDVSCRSKTDPVAKLWGTELGSATSGTLPVDFAASVLAGEKLVFRVETDLSIDPGAVDWNIGGKMTSVCVEDGGPCRATPADQEDEYSFVADAYVPLHLPIDPSVNGEKLVSALPGEPVLPFIATEPGILQVTNHRDVPVSGDPFLPGVIFAIRKHDGLVEKGSLNDLSRTLEIAVEPGDHVFFEAHAETPFSLTWLQQSCWSEVESLWKECSVAHHAWTPEVTFTGPSGTQTFRPVVNVTIDGLLRDGYVLGIVSPFGGGFHGWRYGVWGGPNDEEIDPSLFAPGADTAAFSQGVDEAALAEEGLDRMDPGTGEPTADRLRAERVQPLIPRRNGSYFGKTRPGLVPRIPAYVSRDGNVFVTRGTMHAGRNGGYVEGGEEAGSGEAVAARFRMGRMSRLSVGDSLTGGVNALFAGVSLGAGKSRSKADVRDMNGDGIVDVLSSSGSGQIGVTLTDAKLLTRRSPFGLAEGGHIQDNRDLSVSFNLGISDAVRSFVPEASVVGALVAMYPGVSGGLGINYSATTGELVDVNGDGLPDVVRRVAGEHGFHVRLNLGTSFAANEDFVPSARWAGGALDDLVGRLGAKIASGGSWRSAGLLGPLRNGTYRAVSDPNMVRRTTALSINDNLGKGVGERFQAVVNWESSIAATSVALMDVNGDGLPDYVRKGPRDGRLQVMLNTGYGFTPERAWNMTAWPAHVAKPWIKSKAWVPTMKTLLDWVAGPTPTIDSIEANGSYSERPTIGFVYTWSFPVWVIRLHLSVGADYSPRKVAGLDLSLQDVNGDGLPDHVLKAEKLAGKENRSVYVRLNGLKKGNLLRSVTRPIGGALELDYARTPPSVAMAGSRWVLAKSVQRDGRGGAPGGAAVEGHDIVTTYAYSGGYHDRAERDFLGFDTVESAHADGTRLVQRYLNGGFATKGLLQREETRDASDRVFVVTENEYADPGKRLVSTQLGCTDRTPFFVSPVDYCQSFDVRLTKTTRIHYEGGVSGPVASAPEVGVSTTQEFLEYDEHENVTRFHDAGDDADPDDDLWATVTYKKGDAAFERHSVSRPESVEARSAGGALLRKREATYDARGNVDTFTAYHEEGLSAVTDLDWSDDGTLKVFKAPSVDGRQYTIEYEYDPLTRTYPVKITDAHGYASTATYDLRFGEVATTTDVNGKVTRRVFDASGRLEKLYGPRSATSALVTVDFQPLAGQGAARGIAWARTANKLPAGGSIDTVVLVDGLQRVIQTKKTADVSTGREDGSVTPGWSVSGQQAFDAMGRVKQQGLTFFQAGTGTEFVPGQPLNPTTTRYDALGRPLTVTSPAEPDYKTKAPRTAVTTTAYGLGSPPNARIQRLRTTVTDANGHVRVAYRSLADRVVAVEERQTDPGAAASHVTTYAYNPVGELTAVRDAQGHETSIGYDLLGRRRRIANLDVGTTEFLYDAMGNMVRKQDSKLRGLPGSPWIRYEYDLDQLVGIRYPEGSATMDVKFEYGPPGVRADNGAGRIVRVVDDAGEETRAYGELGELIRTTRTLRPLKPLEPPMVFTTRFAFDEFGRMSWIEYPDGETVRYEYDGGGLLRSARGDRPATVHYPAASEQYLHFMTYDEFGQRAVVKLGNGAVTKYGYHAENHRLASLHTVAADRTLQNLTYGYDLVGNVTFESNGLGPATESRSGDVSYEFLYDSLDRLEWAKGTAAARPGVTDEFQADYAYSAIHNMTSNKQVHKVTTVTQLGAEVAYPPHTNHDFAYTYGGAGPHQATQIGDTFLTYDANGNTKSECRDHADPTCGVNRDHYRSYEWTEDNRLASVIHGGGRSVTRFIYDAAGERIVKYGRGGASITVGQFFNVKGRTAATKHVFAGTARLASKLLPPGDFASPTLGAPLATTVTTSTTDPSATNPVGDGSPNDYGCDPSDYQPQKCPILVNGEPVVPYPFQDTKVRPATYYYHPDHLGSTSWVTDQNGRVHEHVEYFPYGEVWREPKSDRDGAGVKGQRFLFSGKELDEETGLYYFGARYHDPKKARWLSTDPILADFLTLPEQAQRAPVKLSLYAYAALNPINLIDPDGMDERPKYGDRGPGGEVRVALGGCADCHAGTPGAEALKNLAHKGNELKIVNAQIALTLVSAGPMLARAGLGAIRTGFGALRNVFSGGARSARTLGDLTAAEIRQIQSVVDTAERPLEVVGSAARGTRRNVGTDLPLGKSHGTRSDIDFVAPPSSHQNFKGLEGGLPSLDPKTGIIPGTHNPYIGPGVRFEPGAAPRYLPAKE